MPFAAGEPAELRFAGNRQLIARQWTYALASAHRHGRPARAVAACLTAMFTGVPELPGHAGGYRRVAKAFGT